MAPAEGPENTFTTNIATISLLEYLREDHRPTIVFAAEDGVAAPGTNATWALAYSNPAFNNFLTSVKQTGASGDIEYAAFIQDIDQSYASKFEFAGQFWRVRYFRSRWRIVYCEDELDEGASSRGEAPDEIVAEAAHLSSRPAAKLMPRRGSSETSCRTMKTSRSSSHSTPSSKFHSLSKKSSLADFGDAKEIIDWTQYDVPDLPAFVLMFKHLDWASTLLGPIVGWPLNLRQTVVKMMSNPDPRVLLWGDNFILLYNEACAPIIGNKHPHALGRPPTVAFGDLWPNVQPIFTAAFHHGQATKVKQMELLLRRRQDLVYEEETHFSFVVSPILGGDGKAAGALDEFVEVTNEVIAERRVRTLLKIGEESAKADTLNDVWQLTLRALVENNKDVPFAMLYSVKNSDGEDLSSRSSETASQTAHSIAEKYCWLEGLVGIDETNPAASKSFLLTEGDESFAVSCRQAWSSRETVLLQPMPAGLVEILPNRSPYLKAVVLAIQPISGSSILGFLVIGLNARRPFNDPYRDFLRLLTDRLNTCTASVVLPKEQREQAAVTEETAMRHASLTKQLLLRTQEAERSEANFMRIAHSAPFGMFLLKPDGTPVYLNDSFYELTGVKKADIEPSSAATGFWVRTISLEDRDSVRASWARLVRNKQPISFEYRGLETWTANDGAEADFWLRAMAYPEINPNDDSIVGIQGWLENVSVQKYTAQMQAKRLEEALEHKRQAEQFLDMTSHEIRNPLSAIVLSADSIITYFKGRITSPLTLSRDEAEDTLSAAQTIILCANHQKKLCSDILTLSKLDANLLTIAPDPVNPVFLVQKALKMYAAELQAAGIEAFLVADQSMKDLAIGEIVVDSSRLLQVLINLLTNAIKFTKDQTRREIEVSVSASKERPVSDVHGVAYIEPRDTARDPVPRATNHKDLPSVFLQFAVTDTGKGLSDKEMEVLFRRFSQASPKTYGQYGGSGLGLFISRELTELQGGQIGVSSVSGKGSTFAFYVSALRLPSEQKPYMANFSASVAAPQPISRPTEPPSIVASLLPAPTAPALPVRTASAPPPSLSPLLRPPSKAAPEVLHVLVVEDNIINQKIMAQQLRKQGCIVSVANHGVEALDYLKTTRFAKVLNGNNSAKSLSVMLLDLEMPVMDGLTCIKHVRDMESVGELTGHIPTIAVTANARSEQIANALSAGMDLVVTKPFRIPDLLGQIKALIAGTVSSPYEKPISLI